ncbi:MAG: hypothetical protein JO084_05235 [Bradyrhizobiaceae bacterium]|nr:hypothetical protein [Bradyrhizobiaceae bacterium]
MPHTELRSLPERLPLWLLGCILFSFGVKLFIDSQLGTDPLHAMIIGIVNTLDIQYVKIGVIELIIVVLSLFAWCVWNRRFPIVTVVSVFFTMVVVGFLIDTWNYIHVERLTGRLGTPWALGVAGLFVDAYASALIIMSGFGIRNMDLLAITFVQRLRWPFIVAKMMFEVSFVVVALITHGPVGIATLLFVLIVGSLIQPFMAWNTMIFHLPNYGMPQTRQQIAQQ